MDIFVNEFHQPIKDFDDTPYEDIMNLIKVREWKAKAEKRHHRQGSKTQQMEDNVLRANNLI